MPTTIPTERIDFRVRDIRCAAWLTLPLGNGPHPAVVLVHGLGATRDMMLPQYEQHFAAAGVATLAFDYRYTGASDGQPRQHISAREQHAAVAVVQCPIVHGPGAARRLGLLAALRLTPAIAEDLLRVVLRRGRRYVPIVGPPGSLAMVTVSGAESGWNSTVPSGFAFDNRIVAADAVAMVTTSALRRARHIDAPLLVCVCDRESLMDPAYAALVARRAPRGVARHYNSDHFEIYHPPLVARVLADQTAFLQEHLDVHA